MNSFLFNRQLGSISHRELAVAQNHRLLQALQYAPNVRFNYRQVSGDEGDHTGQDEGIVGSAAHAKPLAHVAGVNSIVVDRFEGRYLLSGGADSSVALWDLERVSHSRNEVGLTPIAHVARSSTKQSLGITHVGFYPFDSLAFLTSGYDQTLKLFSSETLAPSATFDLGSIVYSHATSTVSTDLLVACATQHPAVRLVDLRSGASTHSLAGHSGSVVTVAWHPKNGSILASGAADGCVRLWDVRRSANSLGVLDMDDSIGIAGYDRRGTGARRRERGKAHNGTVNGLAWTEDGRFLVTCGHDERMRVWSMEAGANTLANFGPVLRNSHMSVNLPLLALSDRNQTGTETVFVQNGEEILCFDLHSGTLSKRLRATGIFGTHSSQSIDRGIRNLKSRTTSLAWRPFSAEMYSAHSDGTIRCWWPKTWEDQIADAEEDVNEESERELNDRKRKREELDQIVRQLTMKPVTFS